MDFNHPISLEVEKPTHREYVIMTDGVKFHSGLWMSDENGEYFIEDSRPNKYFYWIPHPYTEDNL